MKNPALFPLAILLLAVGLGETRALPPDEPSILSSALWSPPNGVRVLANTAYVAHPTGLAVFDVSDPSAPQLLGRAYCSGWNSGIRLDWPYAFVGGDVGIRSFAVLDPARPREIGVHHSLGEINDFIFVDSLAYIACGVSGSSGLEIVDCGDPFHPARLSFCPLPAALSVAISGSYALLPGYHEGVAVVDISQPAQPLQVGRWTTGAIVKIRIDAGRAYCLWASGEKVDGTRDDSGMIVYDIADPLQPIFLGEYQDDEWSADVYFHENLVYLTSGEGSARIIDCSDPANPIVVGRLVTGGRSLDFDFCNDIAYVADAGAGLVTADVSDPAAPFSLGSYWEAGHPMDIAVDVRAAYIADATFGLHIIDVADYDHPEVIARLALATCPERIAVSDRFVYLGHRDNGLDVVDVTDLQQPELAAHLDLPVSGIAIATEHVYVVDDDRFTVVAIADPRQPQVVGTCTLPLWARKVCVHGGFAYVGNTNVGLVVVDIADPAQPFMRGSVDTFDWMYDVATDGSYVYANLGHNRLGVYDVSNPDAPWSIHELQLPGWLNGIQVAGNRLFAAATPGIRTYDLSDPANPIEVGVAAAQGVAVQVRDQCLYMIGGGALLVLGPSPSSVNEPAASAGGLRILASNPGRGDAVFRIRLDRRELLRVAVHDVTGRCLTTLFDGIAAGDLALRWPRPAAAGTYFIRAESRGATRVCPLRLLD